MGIGLLLNLFGSGRNDEEPLLDVDPCLKCQSRTLAISQLSTAKQTSKMAKIAHRTLTSVNQMKTLRSKAATQTTVLSKYRCKTRCAYHLDARTLWSRFQPVRAAQCQLARHSPSTAHVISLASRLHAPNRRAAVVGPGTRLSAESHKQGAKTFESLAIFACKTPSSQSLAPPNFVQACIPLLRSVHPPQVPWALQRPTP